MKNDYTLKTLIALFIFSFITFESNAQIRIIEADPSTNTMTIRNYGSANNPQNIANYWLCKFPTYQQFSGMTV